MTISRPRVSVCVLTCNQQHYIKQCIESVLAQAPDASLEILVGDDCSDDGTSEIVAALASRYPQLIHHIRHDPRVGVFANCKYLLSTAQGEIVAFLDGDDYWLPGKLRSQLAFIDANSGCAAVYTNALTITESGEPIGLFNDVGEQRFNLAQMLRRGNFLNSSSVLVRADLARNLIEIEGAFIDYSAHLRYARSGFLAQLAQPLVAYRVNSTGSMVSGANDKVRGLYWDAIQDVPRDLVTDDDFAHGIADFLRRVTFRTLRTRRWQLLREWVPRVFQASPYGVVRTGLLVLAAIFRWAFVEVTGRLRKGPDGIRIKVLYRR